MSQSSHVTSVGVVAVEGTTQPGRGMGPDYELLHDTDAVATTPAGPAEGLNMEEVGVGGINRVELIVITGGDVLAEYPL